MSTNLMASAEKALPHKAIGEMAIQNWLVMRVAALANQGESEVDIRQPFSAFALDSVSTVALTGELQDWLAVKLAPTLLWDYPTIQQLARHLVSRGAL
jgi:8-amino-7-oxononanoate synthase